VIGRILTIEPVPGLDQRLVGVERDLGRLESAVVELDVEIPRAVAGALAVAGDRADSPELVDEERDRGVFGTLPARFSPVEGSVDAAPSARR
jgi:hypothetical protein